MSKRKANESLKSSVTTKKSKLEFKKPVDAKSKKSNKSKKSKRSKRNRVKKSSVNKTDEVTSVIKTPDDVKELSRLCGYCKEDRNFSDEYICDIIYPGFVYCNIDCLNKYRGNNWTKKTDIYDDGVSIYTIQNGCFQKCQKPIRDEEDSKTTEKYTCDWCDKKLKWQYFQDETFTDHINEYTCIFCDMTCLNLYRNSNDYKPTDIYDEDISICVIRNGKVVQVDKPAKPETLAKINNSSKMDEKNDHRNVKDKKERKKELKKEKKLLGSFGTKINNIVTKTKNAIDDVVKKFTAKVTCDYCGEGLNPNYAYTKDDTILGHEFCDRTCLDLFREDNGMGSSKSKNVHLYLDGHDEIAIDDQDEEEEEDENKTETVEISDDEEEEEDENVKDAEDKDSDDEVVEKEEKEIIIANEEKKKAAETSVVLEKDYMSEKIWSGIGTFPQCANCYHTIRVCYLMDDEIIRLSKGRKFGPYFCDLTCINYYRINHGLTQVEKGDERYQEVYAFLINTVTGKSIQTTIDLELFTKEKKEEEEKREKQREIEMKQREMEREMKHIERQKKKNEYEKKKTEKEKKKMEREKKFTWDAQFCMGCMKYTESEKFIFHKHEWVCEACSSYGSECRQCDGLILGMRREYCKQCFNQNLDQIFKPMQPQKI